MKDYVSGSGTCIFLLVYDVGMRGRETERNRTQRGEREKGEGREITGMSHLVLSDLF